MTMLYSAFVQISFLYHFFQDLFVFANQNYWYNLNINTAFHIIICRSKNKFNSEFFLFLFDAVDRVLLQKKYSMSN